MDPPIRMVLHQYHLRLMVHHLGVPPTMTRHPLPTELPQLLPHPMEHPQLLPLPTEHPQLLPPPTELPRPPMVHRRTTVPSVAIKDTTVEDPSAVITADTAVEDPSAVITADTVVEDLSAVITAVEGVMDHLVAIKDPLEEAISVEEACRPPTEPRLSPTEPRLSRTDPRLSRKGGTRRS